MGSTVNGGFGLGEAFIIGVTRSEPLLSLQTSIQPYSQVEREIQQVLPQRATRVPNRWQDAWREKTRDSERKLKSRGPMQSLPGTNLAGVRPNVWSGSDRNAETQREDADYADLRRRPEAGCAIASALPGRYLR
jgi:hypothetical protein